MKRGCALVVLILSGVAQAQVASPWGSSIFAGGNVGSASAGFGGNVGNGIVARGNVYGSNLNASGGIYAQFSAAFSGALNGGLHAGSSVTLSGGSVSGGLWSGGSLLSSIGTTSLTGGAFLTGANQSGSHVTIGGGLATGVAYAQPLDFAALYSYYQNAGNLGASLASTNSALVSGSQLRLAAGGTGTQVFNITAAQIAGAQSILVDAAAGTTVLLNISGDAVTLNGAWSYTGGIGADHVLINANSAFSVDVGASNIASILATDALITLNNANVHGSIVGLGVAGRADVSGNFAGVVPTPGVLAALACGGMFSVRRRRAR